MSKLLTHSFYKRLISTLVLAPLVLWIIYEGGLLFYALMGLIGALAVSEWINLCLNLPKASRGLYAALGCIYISLCIYCFMQLPPYYNILLIFGVWLSDIGAYIIGKKFGKARLCPSISPNKTVSGLISASLFPALIMYLISLIYIEYIAHDSLENICKFSTHNFELSLVYNPFLAISSIGLFVLFLIVGLAGQAGDLLMSAMKRQANVKDTGSLIPGHGGILDRIDAILLSSAAFLGMLMLARNVFCY